MTAQPWLALSVTASLWLFFLSLGSDLLTHAGPGVTAAPRPLAMDLAPWEIYLELALVGFVSAVALSPETRLVKRVPATTLVLLFWLLALTGLHLDNRLPGGIGIIGFGILSLVLGLILGALSASAMRRFAPVARRDSPLLALLAAGCAAFLTLAPLSLTSPLTDPFASVDLETLITRVPQQFYLLIKASMLWAPLGFVLAAAGLTRFARSWIAATFTAFFLVGWPFFDQLQAGDLPAILSAPIGSWVGLWLGERSRGVGEAAASRIGKPDVTLGIAKEILFSDTGVGGSAARHPPAPGVPHQAAALSGSIHPPDETPQPSDSPIEPRTPSPDPGPLSLLSLRTRPAPPSVERPEDRVPPASPAFGLPRPHPIALIPALGLLAVATWGWWDFPRFQLPLGIALLLYLLLLAGFRHAWLLAAPTLLVVLDLAPWTGRFFFDESDIFLLVTLGAALLHRPDPKAGSYLARPVFILACLFAATTTISLLTGLLPLSPPDANALASYFSHYNALRVGKGFAWGLAFFLLLRWTLPRGSEIPARLLTAGMLIALSGVILIGVVERRQYADLLDFSATYRITASFSSMHTGDSHLPAFLTLAVPFIWLWVARRRDVLGLLVGPLLLAGAAYLVVSTVTRASLLALVVELLLLSLFWLRGLRGRGARIALPLAVFAVMSTSGAGILYLGTQGSFFQQRMSQVERDSKTRLDHWRQAIWMMDRDLGSRLFGMGLGTFPETYLQQNPLGLAPGNFRYASEAGNDYLLLGSGETLYLAQRVSTKPNTNYRLAFDLRGDKERLRLTIPLCEKHLLDSRDCVWNTYQVPGTGNWEHEEVTLNSGRIGRGNFMSRPPVEIFLYNGEKNQLVAVDNLSLRAPDGAELLRNGDFSAGGDFWFFKTHDHLAWHIKNLWVSLLFEQGWIGLMAFNLLLLALLIYLGGHAWRSSPVPAAVLSALAGFLSLGLFSSPFDAPRLTALFFAVIAVGLHSTPAIATMRVAHRSSSRGHGKRRQGGERSSPETSTHRKRLDLRPTESSSS